jgi:hypothetical protein
MRQVRAERPWGGAPRCIAHRSRRVSPQPAMPTGQETPVPPRPQ